MASYEYRSVTFDRKVTRADIRAALTDEAEYGHWELHRSVIYIGGKRRVWLRRKILRQNTEHTATGLL